MELSFQVEWCLDIRCDGAHVGELIWVVYPGWHSRSNKPLRWYSLRKSPYIITLLPFLRGLDGLAESPYPSRFHSCLNMPASTLVGYANVYFWKKERSRSLIPCSLHNLFGYFGSRNVSCQESGVSIYLWGFTANGLRGDAGIQPIWLSSEECPEHKFEINSTQVTTLPLFPTRMAPVKKKKERSINLFLICLYLAS